MWDIICRGQRAHLPGCALWLFTLVATGLAGCGASQPRACYEDQPHLVLARLRTASPIGPVLYAEFEDAIKQRVYEFYTRPLDSTGLENRMNLAFTQYWTTMDQWAVYIDREHSSVIIYREGWRVKSSGHVERDPELDNGRPDWGEEQVLLNPDTGLHLFPVVIAVPRDGTHEIVTVSNRRTRCNVPPIEQPLAPGLTPRDVVEVYRRDERLTPGGFRVGLSAR